MQPALVTILVAKAAETFVRTVVVAAARATSSEFGGLGGG